MYTGYDVKYFLTIVFRQKHSKATKSNYEILSLFLQIRRQSLKEQKGLDQNPGCEGKNAKPDVVGFHGTAPWRTLGFVIQSQCT